MTDLPPIERLQAVALGPNDVLVATIGVGISVQGRHQIHEAFKAAFPNNRTLIVTDKIEVAAYRPIEETT